MRGTSAWDKRIPVLSTTDEVGRLQGPRGNNKQYLLWSMGNNSTFSGAGGMAALPAGQDTCKSAYHRERVFLSPPQWPFAMALSS